MVSVTTKNFDEQIKIFAEKLGSCSFVAFDEEMTGIMLDPECTPQNSDSVEERYKKMKKIASTYNLMQVGFCFFHEQADGSFVGTPFNFYVFPAENSGQKIQMDASTAYFHRKNCMNFNEWIYFGVPFVNCAKFDEDVERINSQEEDDGKDSKKRLSITNKKDKDFVAFILKRLEAWIEEKRGGKAEALPQVDGDGDGAVDGAMEVEATADGAATAPPAEAESQEGAAAAAADPAAADPAAADPAAAAAMEVEGAAAGESKGDGESAVEEPKAETAEAAPAVQQDSAPDAAVPAEAEAAAPAAEAAEEPPAPVAKEEPPAPVFPEPRQEGDAFVIPECNSFLRKAFYQEIRASHPTLFLNSAAGNNKLKEIFVTLEPNADSKEKKLEELEKQSGFRKVYVLLAESKKPLVGHNCLFDLLFLYSHFEGELPNTVNEWKKAVHARFPNIYDTKVLGTAHGYGETALPKLHQALAAAADSPTVAVDPAFSDYTSKDGLHEAGFDAWLTGSIFARLGAREILADANNKYKNRLHLARSLQLLNLAGADESISGAIFYSSFPDTTVTKDLLDVFGSPLHISGVPARVTSEEFEAALGKIGEVEFALLSANPDGKSAGSGFVAFKDANHIATASAAVNGSKTFFGGDGEEAALKSSPLRVSVQWIDDTSAYLVLPTCTNAEGEALLAARTEKSTIHVVTLDEFKGAGKGKRGRQSAGHDTPSKGGKKGKGAKQEEPPKTEAPAPASKDRKSAAAEAAEEGAAGGRGGRKRGRASTEEAPEEEVTTKKSARGGRHSKVSAEAEEAKEPEKEEEKEAEKQEEKEEGAAADESPEKQPAAKGSKRGAKAPAKGKAAPKRGAKAAAQEEEEEKEEKEEGGEEKEEASPAKAAEPSPAKPAGGRSGKRGAKSAAAEEKAEEPAAATPDGGRPKRGGKAAPAEKEEKDDPDKMEEDEAAAEEEEDEAPQKGSKGKSRKGGKDTKAAPKAEPAPTAATGKSPRGKAAPPVSPAPAEDESKGRRRSGRR